VARLTWSLSSSAASDTPVAGEALARLDCMFDVIVVEGVKAAMAINQALQREEVLP
jgi:hypothetical protein